MSLPRWPSRLEALDEVHAPYVLPIPGVHALPLSFDHGPMGAVDRMSMGTWLRRVADDAASLAVERQGDKAPSGGEVNAGVDPLAASTVEADTDPEVRPR